jgi:hypothetical protein
MLIKMTLPPFSDAELIGEDIGRLFLNFKKIIDKFKYVKVSIIVFVYMLIFYLMTRRSM